MNKDRHDKQGDQDKMSSYTENDLLSNHSTEDGQCPICQDIESFSYDGKDFICTSCDKQGTKKDLREFFKSTKAKKKEKQEILELGTGNQEVLQTATEYYHKTLLEDEKAKQFLMDKNIYNVEAIKVFKLGYCDRSLGKRLPKGGRPLGEKYRQKLVDAGLFCINETKDNRQVKTEAFVGALTVPLINQDGIIHQMYGRKLVKRRKRTDK